MDEIKEELKYEFRYNKNKELIEKRSILEFMYRWIDYKQTENVVFENVDWVGISQQIKTKSRNDCRLFWGKVIFNQIYIGRKDYNESEEEELVRMILE